MNSDKLTFLLILLFSFSSYCMEQKDIDEIQPTRESFNDEETVYEDNPKREGSITEETSNAADGESDFPPIELFLDEVSLLQVESIIDELKEAKRKNKNSSTAGITFYGPLGTGKFTLAQIIRKAIKWKIFAIESQDLIFGQYLVNEDEDDDEQIAGDPINKVLQKIIKNLEIGDTVPKSSIIRTIRNVLLIIQRLSPVILFLHNIDDFAKSPESYSAFALFTKALKQFRPYNLLFVISSMHPMPRSELTRRLYTEVVNMFELIWIKRPNYKKRSEIMQYYFNKYQMNTELKEDPIQAKKNIRGDVFTEILTATRKFSGSDVEEMICRAGRALDAGIQNRAKVSIWFIIKNDIDIKNRKLEAVIMIPLSPLLIPAAYAILRSTSSDAEEFLWSFCSIQQNKVKLKKTLMLAEKIARGEQEWSLISLIYNAYNELSEIKSSIYTGGLNGICYVATNVAKHVIEGTGKGLQNVSERYVTIHAERKFPEIKTQEDKKQ